MQGCVSKTGICAIPENHWCSGKAPRGVQYLRNKEVNRFQRKAPRTIIKVRKDDC